MFIHTNLILIFTLKQINSSNIVPSIETVKIKWCPIGNISEFFLQFIKKIKTFNNVNFFLFLRKIDTNLLLTNLIFLGKNNIVIIKFISEFRIKKEQKSHNSSCLIFIWKVREWEFFFLQKYLSFPNVSKHLGLFFIIFEACFSHQMKQQSYNAYQLRFSDHFYTCYL